tara:strand:- start:579 stop:1043 length:465 start_codon:yes stop_codon:yes gene_type:complete
MLQQINIDWIDSPKHNPHFVSIKTSPLHNKGAFSNSFIPQNTFLGHYMGRISTQFITGPYVFHSKRNNNVVSIDASDINYSNWTRYMNCSFSHQSENVTPFFLTNKEHYIKNTQTINLEGYIVFYAKKDIQPGQELLYYYGDAYAKLLNITYKL